MQIIQKST